MSNPKLFLHIQADPLKVAASVWLQGGFDPVMGTTLPDTKYEDVLVGVETYAESPTINGTNFQIRFFGIGEAEIAEIDVVIDPPYAALFSDPTYDDDIEGFVCQVENDYNGEWIGKTNPVNFIVSMLGGDEPPLEEPLNQVFLISREKLDELRGGNLYAQYQDGFVSRSDFIVNFLELPFKLEAGYIGATTDIFLGDATTFVSAPTITSELIYLDLGEIFIDDLDNNSADFIDVKYDLFIPFNAGVVTLEPSEVNGKTISAMMIVDVYSGDTTLNVYNGATVPIRAVKIKIGRKAPLKMSRDVVENQGEDNSINSGFNFMFLRKFKPELMSGVFNNLVSINGVLASFSGFIIVDNMELKTNASLDEQNEIMNILKSGVLVK